MTAAISIPLDDPDDEPADSGNQHESELRVSFFDACNVDAELEDHDAWDAIEDADDAVCASVWAIFARESTRLGFDARSKRSIRASKALAKRRALDGVLPDGGHPWESKTLADRERVAKAERPAAAVRKGSGR
jgi:hypothetical protein